MSARFVGRFRRGQKGVVEVFEVTLSQRVGGIGSAGVSDVESRKDHRTREGHPVTFREEDGTWWLYDGPEPEQITKIESKQ